MNALRLARATLPAALAAAAVVLGGCRTSCSSCAPPSDMGTRAPVGMAAMPPCAPPAYAPSPCAPPMAMLPPPAPPASFDVGADEQARLDALQKTIALQREQLDLQQREMARLADGEKTKSDALEQTKSSRLDAEAHAQRLADELRTIPGASVLVEGAKVSVIVTDCFDSGSDRLKPHPDVRAALRAAASAVLRHPEAKVAVVGHTDSKPIQKSAERWTDNVSLSKARAESVAKAMSSDGVQRERLAVDGPGAAEMLVVPEKTAADRARNRRVEVQFSFDA
jgi:flagellar motor protein MotB